MASACKHIRVKGSIRSLIDFCIDVAVVSRQHPSSRMMPDEVANALWLICHLLHAAAALTFAVCGGRLRDLVFGARLTVSAALCICISLQTGNH